MNRLRFLMSRGIPACLSLIVASLLSVAGPTALATPVTLKQASAVVAGWLSQDRQPLGESLGASVQRVDALSDKSGNPLYYVVYLAPSGFVIVGGDDLVEPIIGFAPAGKYDPSATNPLGALVNDDIPARVAHARQMSAAALGASAQQASARWRQFGGLDSGPAPNGPAANGIANVSDVRVAPFVVSTWDQGTAANAGTTACYNYNTPPYGDGNVNNYWAGCVATAMAQLMRYYQYPSVGIGFQVFWISYDGGSHMYYARGGDGSGGPYLWNNMPLRPTSTPTTAECEAIGALVADAGGSVGMSYSSAGSFASASTAGSQLANTFLFACARYTLSTGDLIGMINPNLDARYPVLLGIEGSIGGHAVLADGYGYSASTLYHHLNLGWSGVSTAWYALPLVDTSIGAFTAVDSCVYNIYTNGSGEIISGRVVDQIGRPVVGATVSATGTGGPYTSTADTNGIYALARIPSSSSYSVTITRSNYSTVSGSFSTGTSANWGATSGNYWGADFTMNMLTTALDHLAWGAVGTPQSLNTPFGVTISARNLTNGVATGFSGTVALSAFAAGAGASTTIIGNLTSGYYIYGSEMTLGYSFTPNTNLQVTAVRGYNTDKVSIWTDGGTPLGSQAVSASGSWTEATLASPITLSAGTTYRVGAHLPSGWSGYYKLTSWPSTFANGTVGQNFYYSYGDVCPVSVQGTSQGPLVDLRYQVVFSNAIPVSPTTSSPFVNGVWNGNITVSQLASNVVLKADDGAGHTALSTPFNVIAPIRLLSPQYPRGGRFQCTVSSAAGLRLEILASTNLSSWTSVTNLTNTTGTILFTEPATTYVRRFYRAHQVP